jgi:hypothetical protein
MAKRRQHHRKAPCSDRAAKFCMPLRLPGVFPRPGSLLFIDDARIDAAIERRLVADPSAPLIMGVTIAHELQDRTVIRFRRGLDARSIPPLKFYIPSRMQTADRIMEQVALHKPAAVFIDATGSGGGVHARLAQLCCPHLMAVDVGAGADSGAVCSAAGDDARYANKRTEMWGLLKEWCKAGCLPDDRDLAADLSAVEYGYDASDAILLERPHDMKRRGLASPDDGDALALTFAYPVAQRCEAEERRVEELIRGLKRRVV